ncbi:MAG: YggS family pyridoxal phosphate-dependent enzyme [Dehalococcoidales bacterium]
MTIKQNVNEILGELMPGVQLVAAAKTKTISEVLEAIEAGVTIIGENYLQEAEAKQKVIGNRVKWHFIGYLQSNKVKKAAALFDMIETIDSIEIASLLNKRCAEINKVMPVLVEINSAAEPQKAGVLPEDAIGLIQEIAKLDNIKVVGLMTMGPWSVTAEELRPYFAKTKELFEEIAALNIQNVEMKYLSMGMTDSYKVAMQEGANIVRIGSKIFGARTN